jgi:hypothetical protein
MVMDDDDDDDDAAADDGGWWWGTGGVLVSFAIYISLHYTAAVDGDI